MLRTPKTMVRDIFTMIGSASVYNPVHPENNEADLMESEGLFVEVYTDKVKIMGRDFRRRQWVPQAMFEIPVK